MPPQAGFLAAAHNYYPGYLWDNDKRVAIENPPFSAHQKMPANSDPNNPESYKPFAGSQYAPDLISEQARQFIRKNHDRPFFLYYPTTVPHLALQVPEDSLAEYRGKFEETPYLGDRGYLPHPCPHAAYAAMITRMDREIGSIIATINELGLGERTIFIFTSDNGPLYDQMGGTDSDFFNSASGLRGRKGSLFEGGIRVPGIVYWKNHVSPGKTIERVVGFEDWLPTLLDLIGATQAIPAAIDGISMAPTLLGHDQPERPFLYREFPAYLGYQSVRIGDWVGIRENLRPQPKKKAKSQAPTSDKSPLQTELYNLREDRAQEHDVAAQHPDVIAKIETIMREQHTPSKVFPLPTIDR